MLLFDGAFKHVLSLQLVLVESQKQAKPKEFLIQAASKVIAEQVVFVLHPPPVFAIQFYPGRYASHSPFVVIVMGAFVHLLF